MPSLLIPNYVRKQSLQLEVARVEALSSVPAADQDWKIN